MSNRSKGKGSCLGAIVKFIVVVAILCVIAVLCFKFIGKSEFLKIEETEETMPEKVVVDTENSEGNDPDDGDSKGNGNETEITFKAQKNEYNILILGYDKTDNITDAIFVLNIDDNDGDMSIMQIPADTYFNIDADSEKYEDKVSNIFASRYDHYTKNGKKNDEASKKGLADTKKLMSDGLFVAINHAVLMDAEGFSGIVDSLEGIEVNFSAPVTYFDTEHESEVTIPAGRQTLNGDKSKAIVMLYGVEGIDLERITLQKKAVNAFVEKIQSTITPVKITKFLAEVVKATTTDMSMDVMLTFITNMLKYGGMSTVTVTMPSQICDDTLVMNKAGTLEMINRYFNTYDKEIPVKYFDSDSFFCDSTNVDAVAVYSASPDELSVENGFVTEK